MTLDELAEAGRQYKVLGGEIEQLEKRRREVGRSIVEDLSRRKLASRAHAGVTITLTSRRTGIDVELLKERARPAVLRKVTRLVADSKAIRDAVKAGELSDDDVVYAETRSAPFPTVTLEAA